MTRRKRRKFPSTTTENGDIGIGHSWGMTSYSFGNLVYNHFHGFDVEKGGLDSNVDSWNDFGVCVNFK